MISRAAILIGAVTFSQSVWCVEKWAIASNSDAVVTARMEAMWWLPWFGRLHGWGNLRVLEVVAGSVGRVEVIRWQYNCENCAPIRTGQMPVDPAVWCLEKMPNGRWTSAAVQAGDVGYRPLPHREEFLEMQRQFPNLCGRCAPTNPSPRATP